MATKTWSVNRDARTASSPSSLGAGACAHLDVGTYSGYDYHSHLHFNPDWSGIPNAGSITSAVLYIYRGTNYHIAATAGTMRVRQMTGNPDFAEGTASHPMDATNGGGIVGSSRGAYGGTAFTVSIGTGFGWYAVDITSIVTGNFGASYLSLALTADSGVYEFNSREAGNAAYLYVTYNPNTAPNAPTLGTPSGGAVTTGVQPTLNATHSDPQGDACSSYDVQVDDNSDFSSPVLSLTGQTGGISGNAIAFTNWGAVSLSRGTTYYWRMRTTDPGGLTGSYSAGASFVVSSLPSAAPSGSTVRIIHNIAEVAVWTSGGNHAKARLTWTYSHAQGVAQGSCIVRIYDAAAAGSLLSTQTVNGTATSLDSTYAMVNGTSYWYTVQPTDANGLQGAESARVAFKVRWGQAIYEYQPSGGASTSGYSFTSAALPAACRGAFLFSSSAVAGTGGLTWVADIGSVTPNVYVKVLVRLSSDDGSTQPALADMTFSYLGSAISPDNWIATPSGEWKLQQSVRRFGTQSYQCAVVSGTTGDRYIYPQVTDPLTASQVDVAVTANTKYTFSAWVKTGSILTGGAVGLAVYAAGTITNPIAASATITDSTSGGQDGWKRLSVSFTSGPGDSRVRPMIRYFRTSGVNEQFYVDGAKLEEGTVATAWTPGFVADAVVLDAGGLAIDGQAGGTFRLRGSAGTARDQVSLGANGLVLGGDTALKSDAVGVVKARATGATYVAAESGAGDSGFFAQVAGDSAARIAAVSSGGTTPSLSLGPGNANRDVYFRRTGTKAVAIDDGAGGSVDLVIGSASRLWNDSSTWLRTGYLRTLSNGASVSYSTSQSYTASAQARLDFQSTERDDWGWVDLTNDRLTNIWGANVHFVWFVDVKAGTTTTGWRRIIVRANGTTEIGGCTIPANSAGTTALLSASGIVQLAANGYLEFLYDSSASETLSMMRAGWYPLGF